MNFLGLTRNIVLLLAVAALSFQPQTLKGQESADPEPSNSVQGLYKAILMHEGTNFYQYANITLRTINPGGGNLKISANVRIFFGGWDSNEFLTYEYDEAPLNLLTREISVKDAVNDVSMIGFLRANALSGRWFSTINGYVGRFIAKKGEAPAPPEDGILVRSLTGQYQGGLINSNPDSNLPEKITMTLVTTQDTGTDSAISIRGNTRLYLGEFGSLEYVELKLKDIQFNFYSRYLTVNTSEYGLTYKGYLAQDGTFEGEVFAEGIGKVGPINLTQQE